MSTANPATGDLARTRVDAAVARLGPLPVFSGTVARVVALTDDPESATGDIVTAIESDGAFAANLLRYVNSAATARPLQAQSVRQAVVMVGRLRIRQLALETGTYGFLESVPGNGPVVRGQMHLHALAVAGASSAIATACGHSGADCYLAGLLHDFGKLVIPLAFGEEAADQLARDVPRGTARALRERATFGIDHAVAGASLAKGSGAPQTVVDAIAAHHGVEPLNNVESAAVALGNALVAMLDGADPDIALVEDALGVLGLQWDDLEGVAQSVASGQDEQSEIATRVATLDRLAHTDDLTGLPNRRSWIAHVTRRLGDGATGAILMCDVDRFKQVNDTNGHRYGDLVLMQLGKALSDCGYACRFGGDEFAVWVERDATTAAAFATVLLERLAAGAADGSPPVGLSIGVVGVDGRQPDVDELVHRADVALYDVKAAGGRAVRIADAA